LVSSARFEIEKSKSLSDEYICSGTRHRILVPNGKLGKGLEAGHPVLLEPGKLHLKNSPLFQYKGSVDINEQVIQHGSIQIVTVKEGQFGVTYNSGVIQLLEPGRHTLEDATHVLGGFVSAGVNTLRISEVVGMSGDNVELKFDAAICMKVVDAQLAVTMLTSADSGSRKTIMQQIYESVQERAKLALSIIIGNNRLNKKHAATATNSPSTDSDSNNSFRQNIHDSFMAVFSQSMLDECGISVIDMSIEDVSILNEELAAAMASAAVANSSLESTNIDAQIQQVKADTEAKVARIQAEGQAESMKILAMAEANRIKVVSDALDKACEPAKMQEMVKASGAALSPAAQCCWLKTPWHSAPCSQEHRALTLHALRNTLMKSIRSNSNLAPCQ